ncbi:MAG TPA: 23S rRNA (guanosine(2251)-2'-O)-methyltransferase RlmB [Vicinamibacterales bacterium]
MAGDEETIVGIHPVSEALTAGEPVRSVIVAKHRENDPSIKAITDAARRAGAAVRVEPVSWFRRFGDARHQHVAAVLPEFSYADWAATRRRLAEKSTALIVVADHVEDPQNLGAIMRSAEAVGADGLIIPDRRSAGVTAATRRAAAGAASHLAVARVPNLVRALEELKEAGYWVTGLATGPSAVPYTSIDYLGKCVLVVGGEGKGLSRLASERCDHLVKIPMRGKVASLNAAAACAVVLYEAVRQRAAAGS